MELRSWRVPSSYYLYILLTVCCDRLSKDTSLPSPRSISQNRTGSQSPLPSTSLYVSGISRTVIRWDSCAVIKVSPSYLRPRAFTDEMYAGAVKALQVESNICVTGGVDGHIRVWDLDLAELASSSAADLNERESTMLGTPSKGIVNSPSDGLMRDTVEESIGGPCLKTLDGHRKAVTSLFFDDNCLVSPSLLVSYSHSCLWQVTGSSDRTLRQWDLATGQCVLTMDILWAISNPLASQTLSSEPTDIYANDPFTSPASSPRRGLRRQSSGPVTSYSDASWDLYEDYVGSLQFWGYALASGTADGCVRMWDSAYHSIVRRDSY